eukprot:3037039-Rhodomonas_salina.2
MLTPLSVPVYSCGTNCPYTARGTNGDAYGGTMWSLRRTDMCWWYQGAGLRSIDFRDKVPRPPTPFALVVFVLASGSFSVSGFLFPMWVTPRPYLS